MDPALMTTAATTTVTAQTIAATTTTTTTAATATVLAAVARNSPRNTTGLHRAVNVHGRLMYDEIVINDVWINAILSTLALTCAASLCLCFLYCKFQQWKHAAQLRRDEKNSRKYDNDSLPSYTIVTGLPTYDEAIERMKPAAAKSATNAATKQTAVSVVQVKNEVAPAVMSSSSSSSKSATEPKFGLVSHSLIVHDSGCSHCLSVQELLETYNVL